MGKAALEPDGTMCVTQVPSSVFHSGNSFSFSIPLEQDASVCWRIGAYRMPLVNESDYDVTLLRVENGDITDNQRITDQPSRKLLRAIRQAPDDAEPAPEAEPPAQDYVMILFPEDSWCFETMDADARPAESPREYATTPYYVYKQAETTYIKRLDRTPVPMETLPDIQILRNISQR